MTSKQIKIGSPDSNRTGTLILDTFASRERGPEMRFDVFSEHGDAINNMTLSQARELHNYLTKFLDDHEPVSITVTGPKAKVDKVRKHAENVNLDIA